MWITKTIYGDSGEINIQSNIRCQVIFRSCCLRKPLYFLSLKSFEILHYIFRYLIHSMWNKVNWYNGIKYVINISTHIHWGRNLNIKMSYAFWLIEYTKQSLIRHSDRSSQIMSPSISANVILDVFKFSRSASRGKSEIKRKSFKQEAIHTPDIFSKSLLF